MSIKQGDILSLQNFLWKYGENVTGYDLLVINEREARAAAGILFMLGMIVIFVGIGFNHIIVAKVYLTFLWFDFFIRIITPSYSPSMLLGKMMVQNQRPEYVGALQKRFAWTLGWLMAFPMLYWFVLNWDVSFYKVLICTLCLTLIFLESAFSICIGCMIYKFITRENPQYCPGGVCEIRKKEPIQTFNKLQKTVTALTLIAFFTGVYLFLAHTESKTFFGEFLHETVLTKEQLQNEKDEEYQRLIEQEFADEDI